MAVLLAIFAVICYSVWEVVYLSTIYERDYIYHGMGDINSRYNYSRETKQSYLTLIIVLQLAAFSILVYSAVKVWTWAELGSSE